MIELALILLPVLTAGSFLWWDRRHRRDLIWADVTPGERPVHADATTRPVGQRGDDTVTVRFTPPDEMTPGMAGTVIDGTADRRDVAATIIDLAVRRYLTLHAHRSDGGKTQWTISRTDLEPSPNQGQALERHETLVLNSFRHGTAGTRVDELPGALITGTQQALREDAHAHGWFSPPPRISARRLAALFAVLAIVPAAVTVSSGAAWGLALTIGLLGSAVVLALFPTPAATRTAAGTATMLQALGFQRYLATAEARQIRLEEAQDLFSRFLPWAIAFGVADRWARTFAEAATLGHDRGLDVDFDLDWIDGLDLFRTGGDIGDETLAVLDAGDLDVFTAIDAMTSNLGEAGSALGDALSGVVEGVGDFIRDIDINIDIDF